jgi:hypothetical protein
MVDSAVTEQHRFGIVGFMEYLFTEKGRNE